MRRPLATQFVRCFAVIFVFSAPALAEERDGGNGSLTLEYQFIETGTFFTDFNMELDYWSTDTHVLMIAGDYAITDRLTVFAALPYVRKRFVPEVPAGGFPPGGDPHNPNDPYWIDFVPPDKRFWDDGNYHGALQDFSIGLSYEFETGAWGFYPYISYGVPASDYPFFAKAAIGTHLWTLPVGVAVSFVPYFSDWHFDANVAYVFSEEPLNTNVDYWLAHLSAGYWFKANLSVSAFLSLKDGNGISLISAEFINDDATFPPSYPQDFDTIEWWQHDRLIGGRNMNMGLTVDYFFGPEWKLNGSIYQSAWTEESNAIDVGLTLGITRFFGGD